MKKFAIIAAYVAAMAVAASLLGGADAANVATQTPPVTHVTIYTKNFAPFSENGKGYSIDYLRGVLELVHGAEDVLISMQVVGSNDEIIDAVLAAANTDTDYAIGTAGISVTVERERRIDYLPAFFNSGYQVMVRDRQSWNEYVRSLSEGVGIALGGILLVGFVLVFVFAPIAYVSEFTRCPEDKLPKFRDWNDRKEALAKDGFSFDIPEVSLCGYTVQARKVRIGNKARVMLGEYLNTVKWALLTMSGTKTGYPSSKGACLVHSLLKAAKGLLMVLAIPILTNIMANASGGSTIRSYAGLAGESVCTVAGSTSHTYLQENNPGFAKIVVRPSVADMYKAFFDERACAGVVYDFTSLEMAIKARGGGAIVVGPLFNDDKYASVVAPSLAPGIEERLRRAYIDFAARKGVIESLKTKWLPESGKYGDEDEKGAFPVKLLVIFAIIGSLLLVLAFAYVYFRYDANEQVYTAVRHDAQDTDYRDDYEALLEESNSVGRMYEDSAEKVHKRVVPNLERVLRILMEQEERAKGNGADMAEIHHRVMRGKSAAVLQPGVGV